MRTLGLTCSLILTITGCGSDTSSECYAEDEAPAGLVALLGSSVICEPSPDAEGLEGGTRESRGHDGESGPRTSPPETDSGEETSGPHADNWDNWIWEPRLADAVVRLEVCMGSGVGEQQSLGLMEPSLQDWDSWVARLAGVWNTHLGDEVGQTFACLRSAFECESVMACFGIDTSVACSGGATSCLDETTWSGCAGLGSAGQSGWKRTIDCADNPYGNTQCMEVFDGSYALCTSGPCESDDITSSCVGDTVQSCLWEYLRETPCDIVDLTCVETDGEAVCTPTGGEPCESSWCEGSTLKICSGVGELIYELDCAQLGPDHSCVGDGETVTCAVVHEPECTTGGRTCEGDVLKVCIGGRWLSFDCAIMENGRCGIPDVFHGIDDLYCFDPAWDFKLDSIGSRLD